MKDVELCLVVVVNDQRRAAFTLREDADTFIDIVCGEAQKGDDIKLVVATNGEILVHFDESGNQVV